MKRKFKRIILVGVVISSFGFVSCGNSALPDQKPMTYVEENVKVNLDKDTVLSLDKLDFNEEFIKTIKIKPLSEKINKSEKTATVTTEYSFADVGLIQAKVQKELQANGSLNGKTDKQKENLIYRKMADALKDYNGEMLKVNVDVELEVSDNSWKQKDSKATLDKFGELRTKVVEESYTKNMKED